MKIFIDSSFFIAFYHSRDQYHKLSVNIMKSTTSINPLFITTDYVYDETLIYLLKTHSINGYKRTERFDKDIFKERKVSLVFTTEVIFTKAREIFFHFNKDKQWSFTDCTSFAVMEDLGIRNVLTFDKNFTQRGFRVIS